MTVRPIRIVVAEDQEIVRGAMDRPEIRADLVAVRRRELDASVAAIGYDRHAGLTGNGGDIGYRGDLWHTHAADDTGGAD